VTAQDFIEIQGSLPIAFDGASFDTPEHDVALTR